MDPHLTKAGSTAAPDQPSRHRELLSRVDVRSNLLHVLGSIHMRMQIHVEVDVQGICIYIYIYTCALISSCNYLSLHIYMYRKLFCKELLLKHHPSSMEGRLPKFSPLEVGALSSVASYLEGSVL